MGQKFLQETNVLMGEKEVRRLEEKEYDVKMMKESMQLAEKKEQEYIDGVKKRNDRI